MDRTAHISMDDSAQLRVGERLQISNIPEPWSTLTYEVAEVYPGGVRLKIVRDEQAVGG